MALPTSSKQFQLCYKQCGRHIDPKAKFKSCCESCSINTDPVQHDAACDIRHHEYEHSETNTDDNNKELQSNNDDSESWRCVLCHRPNKSNHDKCIMCDKLRPNCKRKRRHQLSVCPDSKAVPFHVCTQLCADRWGLAINEPAKKKQKIEHHKHDKEDKLDAIDAIWRCPLCTFANNRIALQCKVCAMERNHTDEEILKRLKSQHEQLKKTKSELDELHQDTKQAEHKQSSVSSSKQEMDDDEAIDINHRDNSDHDSDNDVALDMFKNGLTPAIVKQKTHNDHPQNNHNKASALLFELETSDFLTQSGFTCIEHDEEDRYIADMIAEDALTEEDYWNGHNMANTIPFIDAGDEIEQMMHGFDHGTISAKRKYHKKPKKSGKLGGVNDINNEDGDEIDEDSVERVNVAREFRYAMNTRQVIRCRLIRRRKFDDFDDGDTHFRICESQFMRSCNQNAASTLKEVIYVINPKLIRAFQAKKRRMKARLGGSGVNTILGWHGTSANNIDSIVMNNFSLSHLGNHTGNTGCYGAGIYFSEYANVSQGYGDGLLLCKIMLGKSYKMQSAQVGCDKKRGYDSHMAGGGGKYGTEIVIFDMDQILPCYIVKH